METKIEQEVRKARYWLAQEFYIFKELQHDLTQLQLDLSRARPAFAIEDIEKALRLIRFLGRSEQKFQRQENLIEEALRTYKVNFKTAPTISEMQELATRLHDEAAQLIHSASMYTGHLRTLLLQMRQEVKTGDLDSATKILHEIFELISAGKEWLTALSSDLKEAQSLYLKIIKRYVQSTPFDDIKQNLESRPISQALRLLLQYLNALKVQEAKAPSLVRRRTMNEVIVEIRRKLDSALLFYDLLDFHVEMIEKIPAGGTELVIETLRSLERLDYRKDALDIASEYIHAYKEALMKEKVHLSFRIHAGRFLLELDEKYHLLSASEKKILCKILGHLLLAQGNRVEARRYYSMAGDERSVKEIVRSTATA